ncbi:MAG: hypothetical protein M3345_01940 [Actinomycetota bacterium]|nr:hypothetical protein [Actinomycetota bacterium]
MNRASSSEIPSTVWIGAALGICLALAVGSIRFFGDDASFLMEDRVGALATMVVLAAPSLLALVGARGRSTLLLAAGLMYIPLSFISFALVTLPLLISGVLFLMAYEPGPKPVAPRVAIVGVVVLAVMGALVALWFGPDDPRCWTEVTRKDGSTIVKLVRADCCVSASGTSVSPPAPNAGRGVISSGGGCTTDVITVGESAASTGLIAVALLVGAALARPRDDDPWAAPAPPAEWVNLSDI